MSERTAEIVRRAVKKRPEAPPPTLRASRTDTLEKRAEQLQSQLRRVRRDPADREAVHDARVALRRLMAAGELWAPHASDWRRLRDRLPQFLRRLGRLRDLDVAIGFLKKGPRSESAARQALSRHLKRKRRWVREETRDWLVADRLKRLSAAILLVVDEVRLKPVLDPPAPSHLTPHLARIVTLLGADPDVDEAHEIRREIRRLRYAHETLEWAYDPAEYKRVAGQLRRIQETAGDWQDRRLIGRLARKAVRRGKVAVPLTALLSRLESESKSLSARFIRAVRRLADLRGIIVGALR